ncbi:cobalamin-dependent protein [bacterium]|nr:cobalamin-dependent protein [bacterium]
MVQHQSKSASAGTKDIKQRLFLQMIRSEKDDAIETVAQYAVRHGYENAVINLLDPVLRQFGQVWASQENVSLAQGYVASRIAEEIMLRASRDQQTADLNIKGPVVIGNAEDDYHALGRKLVVIFLRARGWQVYDMGNDVLPEVFVEKALEVHAPIIGVSAMMMTTALHIRKVRELIDDRGLTDKIKLAVGGAVFNFRPELVGEVGGDGTVRNALSVPDLMNSLWPSVVLV